MRIVSWNINGIRAAVKKGFCEKLVDFHADIIGLQETKASEAQVIDACDNIDNFYRYCNSAQRPGYSGVALLSTIKPQKIISSLNQERFDCEGRFLAAYFDNFLLVTAYFPNGSGKGDNSRVPYKLEFYDAVFDFLDTHTGPKIVMGDFNTAHQEIDIARPKENQNNSGFLPIERQHFTEILSRGYIDTFRHFNSSPHQYTWWTHWAQARKRNVGWRIDGVLASHDAMALIKNAFIWPEVLGSDHCPVGIDLH